MQSKETLTWLRCYASNGNVIHVYSVDCSDKVKQLMKENNPYYREEDGKPLYFTRRDLSSNPKCRIVNGKVRFVTVDLLEGF